LQGLSAEQWQSISTEFKRQKKSPIQGLIISSILQSQTLRDSWPVEDVEFERLVALLEKRVTDPALKVLANEAAICAFLALRMRRAHRDRTFKLLYHPFQKLLPVEADRTQ
jgi:hypothetical protein